MSIAKPGSVLRVVFDTNVYFSALTHPRGIPFRIWQGSAAGKIYFAGFPSDFTRTCGSAAREPPLADSEIVPRLKLLATAAEIVVPKITLSVVAADDDDDRILECAVVGNANLIVSGDHHLRDLRTFEGIAIVRPVNFHRTLGNA